MFGCRQPTAAVPQWSSSFLDRAKDLFSLFLDCITLVTESPRGSLGPTSIPTSPLRSRLVLALLTDPVHLDVKHVQEKNTPATCTDCHMQSCNFTSCQPGDSFVSPQKAQIHSGSHRCCQQASVLSWVHALTMPAQTCSYSTATRASD